MTEIEFRYFKSVEGHIVPRYGTQTYIGARIDKAEGWVWTEDVKRIPTTEVTRYLREYNRALKDGAIVEVKRSDYDAQQVEPASPKRTKRNATNEEG